MKVFISWSGQTSHKVALVLKEWLPCVIQSISPYVSSEDIDKGARWSSDIATELENAKFGILCVTKDNITAPWLTFEAGALSKTIETSHVVPFLFGIKRSEVDGPILQFQSVVLEKDDIKKLLDTLNRSSLENSISDQMLTKAFDTWYPELEAKLSKIQVVPSQKKKAEEKSTSEVILEEVLELSRMNQKLLRQPAMDYDVITKELKNVIIRESDRRSYKQNKNSFRTMSETGHFVLDSFGVEYYFLFIVSQFRDEAPWLYNFGSNIYDSLRRNNDIDRRISELSSFREMVMHFSETSMRINENENLYFISRELDKAIDMLIRNI